VDGSRPNATVARAAALAAMNQTTGDITRTLVPERVFEAQQAVAIALTPWQPASYRGIAFRGRLELTLPEPDLARTEEFATARRAARLEAVLAEDASTSLCETHLSNITTARLWWLRQHLGQPSADLSWTAFDEYVRPLVAEAHRPEDDIDRLAHVLLMTTDRVSKDSPLRETLIQVLQRTFEVMKWSDLAAEIRDLNHFPDEGVAIPDEAAL
jgi:hypothetical protein